MRYAILAAVFLVTACSYQSEPVYLKHPDGRTVQCGPYSTVGSDDIKAAVVRERGCIDDYQRQGFLRVPHP